MENKNNEVLEIIKNRRSIRKFNENEITDNEIEILLRAAMQAPSAKNLQPWRFIVIKNKEMINKISDMSPGANLLKNVNVAVAVAYDNSEQTNIFGPVDCACATENLLLQAASMEIAACWIGVYPHEDRLILTKNVLDTKLDIFSIVALGKTDESVQRYVDRFDESKITVIE